MASFPLFITHLNENRHDPSEPRTGPALLRRHSMHLAIKARDRPSSTARVIQCGCKVESAKDSEFLQRAESLLKENPKAMRAVKRMDEAAAKVESIRERQMQLDQEVRASAVEATKAKEERIQQALEKVSSLETQAAENAVAAAQLETELLQCEKEAMKLELESLYFFGTHRSNAELTTEAVAAHLQNFQRIESGKAAVTAAAGGAVGWAPPAIIGSGTTQNLILSGGSVFIICALFGVLYRYVVSSDPNDPQLKGGAVAAFGLARGLSLAQAFLSNSDSLTIEALASAALLVGQSMLTFAFAALALESAMSRGALDRVPTKS